jgi:uncharacterized protein
VIANTFNQKIAEALKAKDEIKLSTLRLLSSAFNYEKIAKQHDLSDEEEIAVIKREAKKRQDAIESIKLAQGKHTSSSEDELKDKLAKEEKELLILKEFLPKEISDDELNTLIDEAISEMGASGLKDMGRVIGRVMQGAKGAANGSRVAEMVKNKLT